MVNTENELIKRDILHITKEDEGYPMHLKELSGSPAELYYIGSLPDDNMPSVAIIGARNCSGYGRQMAREFAREIAAAGIQVISGMARGIDGMAQQAAVSVGGKSYAVLGCGVDICYPKENKELYVKLMDSGGIISEYPPGIPARAEHFPLRNRIISGLADALLVIEARERSGYFVCYSDEDLFPISDYVMPDFSDMPISPTKKEGDGEKQKQGSALPDYSEIAFEESGKQNLHMDL